MTEEMAWASLWSYDATIRVLMSSMPGPEAGVERRDHVRRLRALEHARDNLLSAMNVMGWKETE